MKLSLFKIITICILLLFTYESLYAQVDSFRKNQSIGKPSSVGTSIGDQNVSMQKQMMGDPSMMTLTYQIHILGEVNNPGTYRINASDRLSEVLPVAGGVSSQGSERRIEIRRNGDTVYKVDLLEYKLYGKLKSNPYLLDNDVIFIPLKKKTVQIYGSVKRPLEYELRYEKNLNDVVNLAGGFTIGATENVPVRVVRFVDGKKSVLEVSQNKSNLKAFKVNDGDVIFVSSVVTKDNKFDYDIANLPGDNVFYPSHEDRVFVLGGVRMPGAYPFSPYYGTHQYITLAGGYSTMATGKVQVVTKEGKKKKVTSKKQIVINPGDTVLVGHRRIPPEGWVSLGMSIAGFGLSTTATVLTLTR